MVRIAPVDLAVRPAAPGALPETADPAIFAPAWAAAQAAALGPGARVALLWRDPDGTMRPRGLYPSGEAPPPALRYALTTALEQNRAVANNEDMAAFALPVRDGDTVVALAGVALPAGGDAVLALLEAHLRWGVQGVVAFTLRRGGGSAADDPETAIALRLMTAALDAPDYRAALMAVADELAAWLGAERVSLCRCRRARSRLLAEAVSHTADFKRRMAEIGRIEAAAQEVVDHAAAIVWPPLEGMGPLPLRAHKALASATGGTVVSVPLGAPENAWGAAVIEMEPGTAFSSARMAAIAFVADAIAPLLEARRHEDRWLIQKTGDVALAHLRRLFGPRYALRKLAALLLLGVAVAAITVTAPHRVTAPVHIAMDAHHVVTAPFDGFIADQPVRPGDAVTAGQVLLALDQREMRLERLRYLASQSQKQVELDRALAAGDRAQAALAEAEIAEIRAQLALIEDMLAAAVVHAPFDGLAVAGDLERRLGAPVSRGEEMLAIAPLNAVKAVLQPADRDFEAVSVGQQGTLRLAAVPERPIAFTITHLTPVTEPVDGENAFRVEARLLNPPLHLVGPGMEGVAKIEVGERLWVMNILAPMIDWLTLALWRWWP